MENAQAKKKIILVDDVGFFLLSMKERLKDNDYEIFPAQSAAILFDILENVTPDLILLDVNMPEVDGFEIMEQLKANARFADIPVIFLTSKTDKPSAIRAMALGAADYVTKPVTNEALIDSIEAQLSPHKKEAVKPIILAVDDSPSILEAIKQILKTDFTVYTMPSPQGIKEVLKKVTPDLFLLDVQMPVLNGYELVSIIRELSEHEDTPIIFLTSEAINDNVYAAVQIGASDFMVKPVDEAVLREKLSKHLQGFILRRRIRSLDRK
ncbi:MAG: response regulator [Defluviitaleaceae bacterium]|nr:response regulator [Defluviitaleaceae bacterium]